MQWVQCYFYQPAAQTRNSADTGTAKAGPPSVPKAFAAGHSEEIRSHSILDQAIPITATHIARPMEGPITEDRLSRIATEIAEVVLGVAFPQAGRHSVTRRISKPAQKRSETCRFGARPEYHSIAAPSRLVSQHRNQV